MSYKGKATKIVILTEDIPVPEGEPYRSYGVPCVHEVMKTKKKEEVHVLAATVPEDLADEMIANGRAHLRIDI